MTEHTTVGTLNIEIHGSTPLLSGPVHIGTLAVPIRATGHKDGPGPVTLHISEAVKTLKEKLEKIEAEAVSSDCGCQHQKVAGCDHDDAAEERARDWLARAERAEHLRELAERGRNQWRARAERAEQERELAEAERNEWRARAECAEQQRESALRDRTHAEQQHELARDAVDAACAWADYRKDCGVPVRAFSVAHKAFLAGWEAARKGDQSGPQR